MSLYKDLGVDKDSTQDEIKKAFREKAKINHEDKGGDKDEMVKLNEAYAVLSNPIKRDRYDKTGESKDIGFDVKFQQLVSTIFLGIIEQEKDVNSVDLVDRFVQVIGLLKKDSRKNKDAVSKKIIKFEKVLSRLSVGSITPILKSSLDNLKMELALIDEQLEFFERAKEVVSHHNYSFEVEVKEETISPLKQNPKHQNVRWSFEDYFK